jgi:hypothetical protein
MKTHKEYLDPENLGEMRRDIMAIMLRDDETIASLSKKIGIHTISLRKFTSEKGDTHLLTLMKIDEYIKSSMENK